jgi:hypothetical protein
VRRLWRGFSFHVMFLFDDCRTPGGLTGIGEGCSDCHVIQASRSMARMAPPPVRHVTAIHEPGLKEGYGDSGLGLIRNQCLAVLQCCAISPCARFFSPAITSPPFPLDYLCGGCAVRYLPDASISVNDSRQAIFSRIMNRGSYHNPHALNSRYQTS